MGRVVPQRVGRDGYRKRSSSKNCDLVLSSNVHIVFKPCFCLTMTGEPGVQQRASRATVCRNSVDQNAPVTAVQNLLVKTEH